MLRQPWLQWIWSTFSSLTTAVCVHLPEKKGYAYSAIRTIIRLIFPKKTDAIYWVIPLPSL